MVADVGRGVFSGGEKTCDRNAPDTSKLEWSARGERADAEANAEDGITKD